MFCGYVRINYISRVPETYQKTIVYNLNLALGVTALLKAACVKLMQQERVQCDGM